MLGISSAKITYTDNVEKSKEEEHQFPHNWFQKKSTMKTVQKLIEICKEANQAEMISNSRVTNE